MKFKILDKLDLHALVQFCRSVTTSNVKEFLLIALSLQIKFLGYQWKK